MRTTGTGLGNQKRVHEVSGMAASEPEMAPAFIRQTRPSGATRICFAVIGWYLGSDLSPIPLCFLLSRRKT